MSSSNSNNNLLTLLPLTSFKAECKASYVGICKIPGSLSEHEILNCVQSLLEQEEEGLQEDLINSSTVNLQWYVSIEGVGLKWVREANEESDSNDSTDSFSSMDSSSSSLIRVNDIKYNRVPFSSILFCSIDSGHPDIISWILTKSNNCYHERDGILGGNEFKVSTEALVWRCNNENDAAKLKETYKKIRNRKKMGIIEAIRLRHQREKEKHEQLEKMTVTASTITPAPSTITVNLNENQAKNPIFSTPNNREDENHKQNGHKEDVLLTANQNCINKANLRQRREPLFIQPAKAGTGSIKVFKNLHQNSGNTLNPMILSSQQQPVWAKQYRSESEFDPTKLSQYIKFNNTNREFRGTENRYSFRSRSVDAPLNRIKMNDRDHQIFAKTSAKLTSYFSKNSGNRVVIIGRSDSLNSEGSSGSGDSNLNSELSESSKKLQNPPKSALKKNINQLNKDFKAPVLSNQNGCKKNVTFNAYATVLFET